MGYPQTDFDNPKKLLSLLGSFWLNTYQGATLVESLVSGRAQLDAQAHIDILELIAAISRFDIPVFHTDNWYFLTLRQSQRSKTSADLLRYDGSFSYGPSSAVYGGMRTSALFTWPVPAALQSVSIVLNRITDASLTMTAGVDFLIDTKRAVIVFRDDPFASSLIPQRDIIEDNQVVDRECGLWLYRGRFDFAVVYRQFGYVLDVAYSYQGESYKQIVNAVFDALVGGTAARAVQRFFGAVADVSLATDTETVEKIFTDNSTQWVITDKNAYAFNKKAHVVVLVGDTLVPGDEIVDVISFVDLGRGVVPSWLSALTIDSNLLMEGYYQGITFVNESVPLLVTEEGGKTRVSFEVHGFPGDVEKFWDDVHARGLSQGKTLAQLIDTRPQPQDTEPTAIALPAMVNPLSFLITNLLRNNAFIVRLKTAAFGRGALGLSACRLLRMIIPPQTLCIIVVELFHADTPVILKGPGSQTESGYSESAKTLAVLAGGQIITADVSTERVRTFQVAGRCE